MSTIPSFPTHSLLPVLLGALALSCKPQPAQDAKAPTANGGEESAAPAPMHPLTVKALNDHLLYFYDGRDSTGKRFMTEWNWKDDAAMKLGIGTYVIHQGGRALVYDTFTATEQAQWVREYLEKMGIQHFTVVYSHWHLDHIGGNAAYPDADVISTAFTRDSLAAEKSAIEAGTAWGPPPIKPLILPTITFEDRLDVYVGDIKVEMHRINIHSKDTNVLYLSADKILLCGDALEDFLTYMVEPGGLPEHVKNLRIMRGWDVATIYPNHGDPNVIMNGGYTKTFIDATIDYITKMVTRSHDKNYLDGTMEDYIGASLTKGWVHLFEPYRDVHKQNLKLVQDYYKDKPLPKM